MRNGRDVSPIRHGAVFVCHSALNSYTVHHHRKINDPSPFSIVLTTIVLPVEEQTAISLCRYVCESLRVRDIALMGTCTRVWRRFNLRCEYQLSRLSNDTLLCVTCMSYCVFVEGKRYAFLLSGRVCFSRVLCVIIRCWYCCEWFHIYGWMIFLFVCTFMYIIIMRYLRIFLLKTFYLVIRQNCLSKK